MKNRKQRLTTSFSSCLIAGALLGFVLPLFFLADSSYRSTYEMSNPKHLLRFLFESTFLACLGALLFVLCNLTCRIYRFVKLFLSGFDAEPKPPRGSIQSSQRQKRKKRRRTPHASRKHRRPQRKRDGQIAKLRKLALPVGLPLFGLCLGFQAMGVLSSEDVQQFALFHLVSFGASGAILFCIVAAFLGVFTEDLTANDFGLTSPLTYLSFAVTLLIYFYVAFAFL